MPVGQESDYFSGPGVVHAFLESQTMAYVKRHLFVIVHYIERYKANAMFKLSEGLSVCCLDFLDLVEAAVEALTEDSIVLPLGDYVVSNSHLAAHCYQDTLTFAAFVDEHESWESIRYEESCGCLAH